MRFSDQFLDEIRDRIPISEVVGRHVAFDRKKTNQARGDFWGCCPFHGEKTPSFHCENRKGRYYCFGCGESGDHFRFLTTLEGLSFPEAVERLADQAGLAMPVFDKREQEREKQRASLYDVMEMASEYFEQQLQAAAGAKARSYLRERGLDAITQKTFRIGYAPDLRNGLKSYLVDKGVGPDQIEACGLVVHGQEIAVSYDRFRDRIMFPILDARERIIAFGGRALRADAPAKYLNSPETELFHKSNVLYNYAKARKVLPDQRQVIVCEGYMDVIAMHSAGIPNAVAPLGTALTERQMLLLWRLHDEPILCFDGDGAGVKAAYRSIDMMLAGLEPGRTARFAVLPEGMDPDDLIQNEGVEAMREVIANAQPLSEMIWARETREGLFDTPERKALLEASVKKAITGIRNDSVRRHYEQDMSNRLASYFSGGQETAKGWSGAKGINRSRGNGLKGSWQGGKGNNNSSRFAGAKGKVVASDQLLSTSFFSKGKLKVPLREASLVMGACNHPAILNNFFDEFMNLQLKSRQANALRQWLVDLHAEHSQGDEELSVEVIHSALRQSEHKEIADQMSAQVIQNGIWQVGVNAAFEDAMEGWRQAYTLHVRARALRQELRAAEAALLEDDNEANMERLRTIQAEISREEGTEALIDGFGLSSGRANKSF